MRADGLQVGYRHRTGIDWGAYEQLCAGLVKDILHSNADREGYSPPNPIHQLLQEFPAAATRANQAPSYRSV